MEENYTEEEVIARHFLLNLWENMEDPCDKMLPINEPDMPVWFDPVKFQKGREFFFKNKWSILESNLVGLICLLADSKGLSILSMTGKSSTVEDAYKRYSSTILHVLTWYYVDLTPKSKSNISLKNVRRAHYNTSMKAIQQKLGAITQTMMSLTAFGFMGFPLIYPNTMGLIDAIPAHIEGFVHFWAVMGYALGIKTEFNLCLLPVEAIETPHFKEMVDIMLEGTKKIVPLRNPRVYLTLTKIYCQIPGYNKFISREDKPNHRQIFTQSELDAVYEMTKNIHSHFPLTTKIPIIKLYEMPQPNENNNDTKNGKDYNYVKEWLQIDDVCKIDIKYQPFYDDKAIDFGSNLFESENFVTRITVRLLFLTKKMYCWSPFCRWILDNIFEREMQKKFGNVEVSKIT